MANEPVIAPPRSWADRRWSTVEEFRGTPYTTPTLWWWYPNWGVELIPTYLVDDGSILRGASVATLFATHVMLTQEGDIPPEPTDQA